MTAKAKAPKSTSGLRRSLANILKSKKAKGAGMPTRLPGAPRESNSLETLLGNYGRRGDHGQIEPPFEHSVPVAT